MDLTREQRMMLKAIFMQLKEKLITFASNTRSRNVTPINSLHNIGQDTLKLFLNECSHEDAKIAIEFVTFVIDTVMTTTSIAKTIDTVEKVYQFSEF